MGASDAQQRRAQEEEFTPLEHMCIVQRTLPTCGWKRRHHKHTISASQPLPKEWMSPTPNATLHYHHRTITGSQSHFILSFIGCPLPHLLWFVDTHVDTTHQSR